MDTAATLPRRCCANHPQRPAIGVCVLTATPICGECSTRYEGVNYSREGLRLLQERRAVADAKKTSVTGVLLLLAAVAAVPVMLYGVYASYAESAEALKVLLHPGR